MFSTDKYKEMSPRDGMKQNQVYHDNSSFAAHNN